MSNETKILLIVFFQIFLLINMTSANSYLIHQSDTPIEESLIVKANNLDKQLNLVKKTTKLLVGFLSIKQIQTVSATIAPDTTYETTNYAAAEYSLESINWNCCPLTKENALCQDIAAWDSESCAVDTLPSKCEYTRDCKQGCCIDSVEGLCTTRATKIDCENQGGVWEDDENCAVQECKKGCCVTGENVDFVTKQRCSRISKEKGFATDFRDYKSELACFGLQQVPNVGACVVNRTLCQFVTDLECAGMEGEFYDGYLCSYFESETGCKRQESVGCVEGKDEIYWFDSCDNRENVYSSDRDKSGNGGKVLSNWRSCNPEENNANSETCGNCDYFLGSKCVETELGEKHVVDGNFICKDLSCVDAKGKVRKNGESWCIYDSYIGAGKDVVGSRHWKRYCIDGEIKTEACADYRGQVCVEDVVADKTGGVNSMASCLVNEAMKCIDYNNVGTGGETNIGKCQQNQHCFLHTVYMSENFQFRVCVPKYPRGLDISLGSSAAGTNSQLCGMATVTCPVVYEKKIDGWKCIANCHCEEEIFTQKMHEFCLSLGDCGSYVNIEGKGTNNINVDGAPVGSEVWTKYVNYKNPVPNQYAQAPGMTGYVNPNIGPLTSEDYDPDKSEMQKALEIIGLTKGAVGLILNAGIWAFGYEFVTEVIPVTLEFSMAFGEVVSEEVVGGAPSVMQTEAIQGHWTAGFFPQWMYTTTQILNAAAVGAIVGTILTYTFSLQGDAGLVMGITGTAVGAALGGLLLIDKVAAACAVAGPFAWICWVIVAIIMAIIGAILRNNEIGFTDTRYVKFECFPWTPPFGGNDCHKCNENPDKPCTRYRCESLGLACGFINEESEENQECVVKYYDNGKPPSISPNNIGYGYSFIDESRNKVKVRTDDGTCIPEFTTIDFSLKTDEYAQCKWDFAKKTNHEEYENYFSEQTSFTMNHSTGFMMPSLKTFEVFNITGDFKEHFGDIKMYVSCTDMYGNSNDFAVDLCVRSGKDKTPPKVMAAGPVNKAILKFGVTKTLMTIELNEPSECRYDLQDIEYDLMRNNMSCKTALNEYSDFGWPCSTNLTGLTKEKNTFYFRCKDQPWIENQTDRNTNPESYVYSLYNSKNNLKIESVFPSGKLEYGVIPVSLDLRVTTSGGMKNNGKSICYYSFESYENMFQFQESGSNIHRQNFNSMTQGNYTIYIKCKDDAGNSDFGSANFKLEIDKTGPEVVGIFEQSGWLEVKTDEPAKCYYDLDRCNFDLENATAMSLGFSETHTAEWNPQNVYHIKCKDSWGNENPDCAIIVTPEEIGG